MKLKPVKNIIKQQYNQNLTSVTVGVKISVRNCEITKIWYLKKVILWTSQKFTKKINSFKLTYITESRNRLYQNSTIKCHIINKIIIINLIRTYFHKYLHK